LIPVLFHPDAEAEFDHSIGFYEERSIGLGLNFEHEVLRGLSIIHNDPKRWPQHKSGARKYTLQRFPFSIYYLNLPDCIWVVAISHGSRKPGYWKDRVPEKPQSE
jgi:toxin ParE1/3/4